MGDEYRYDYFGDNMRDPDIEHRRRVLYQVDLMRTLRDQMDPFAISVNEFKKLYRLPQHLVFELLREIAPYAAQRINPTHIPLEIKFLCALSFYSNGSYQRVVGRTIELALSQATVSNAIEEITTILNDPRIISRYIHFPATREEREVVIERNSILGMPRVLGFIDGTLVKIVPPSWEDHREVYYCRKGYTALNVQVVCDADLNILDVNARYPGSANDRFIFGASGMRAEMRTAYQESHCWLLGDSGYTLEPWLHTPIPHAELGSPEYYYTLLHCHSRNVAERLNGVWKGRFRCLLNDRTLHYGPVKAGLIVNACAVLHNFCRAHYLPNPRPVYDGNDDGENDEDGNNGRFAGNEGERNDAGNVDEGYEEEQNHGAQDNYLAELADDERWRLVVYAYNRRLMNG